VRAGFVLDAGNAAAVAAICRALDGLPLALELAAARTKLLAPEAMLARIARRLPLLTGGARDRPPRHQTLRATIDWSYDLLGPVEQRLFASLGVFVGGCTVETAEQVCDAPIDALASLIDKSLLRQEGAPGGTSRLRMLETVREYALERLGEEAAAALRRRHALYYLELAEAAATRYAEPGGQAPALEQLEGEADNVQAAVGFAEEAGDGELALRLVCAAFPLWQVRGYLTDGRRQLAAALAVPDQSPALRIRALSYAAFLAYRQGDYESAAGTWQETLALGRETGDRIAEARSLGDLGGVAVATGSLRRARDLYEQCAAILRAEGDEARLAIVLGNLGDIALREGDLGAAERLGREAASIQERLGEFDSLTISLHNLGRAALEAGQFERARARFERGLRIALELGYREVIAYQIAGLAQVAAVRMELVRATRLLGAAMAIFEQLGVPLQASERASFDRTASALRTLLGEAAYASAVAAGSQLGAAQAAAEALGEA
jgi:tetratricopeptide (TPR) repeat protein